MGLRAKEAQDWEEAVRVKVDAFPKAREGWEARVMAVTGWVGLDSAGLGREAAGSAEMGSVEREREEPGSGETGSQAMARVKLDLAEPGSVTG